MQYPGSNDYIETYQEFYNQLLAKKKEETEEVVLIEN